MGFAQCKHCDSWGWTDKHICPPVWIVAPEDEPDVMYSVFAVDAEDAAAKAAERYDDEGDHYLARGNEMVFLVAQPVGDILRVVVEGETVPSYRARELGPVQPDSEPADADAEGGANPVSKGGPQCS